MTPRCGPNVDQRVGFRDLNPRTCTLSQGAADLLRRGPMEGAGAHDEGRRERGPRSNELAETASVAPRHIRQSGDPGRCLVLQV
jgi:hypothetical protein